MEIENKFVTGHTGHSDTDYINSIFFNFNVLETKPFNDFQRSIIPKAKLPSMNNNQKSPETFGYKMNLKKRTCIRNKEEFIEEVKKLSQLDKKYLNYSYLRKIKRSDLLYEAIVLFGGWRKAVEIAGFRPIQKGWTKEEVKQKIKEAVDSLGYIPTSKKAAKLGYPGLATSARRRFGSWTKALIAAGFNPFRQEWTREKALEELINISNKLGHSPSMRELKEQDSYDLLNAGLKFFGKYNDFLKAANLSVVLVMNKWPKERVISELKKISEKLGRTPRRNELAALNHYDLINAAERQFPCWSEALLAAGLFPNPDVLNNDKTWRDWENLIFQIIKQKNINFEKKKYIRKVGYPDIYIPSLHKIIEIKLNCSDNSVKKDIEKYLPYCNKLEIWHLYGKPFGILSNKVSFVGPNEIKESINDNQKLLLLFKKIQSEVNKCEQEYKKSIDSW